MNKERQLAPERQRLVDCFYKLWDKYERRPKGSELAAALGKSKQVINSMMRELMFDGYFIRVETPGPWKPTAKAKRAAGR